MIFIDPPYSSGLYEAALEIIGKRSLLRQNGTIVAEWDEDVGCPNFTSRFLPEKERHYGRVHITLLKQPES